MAVLSVLGLDALPPGYLDRQAELGSMPYYSSVRGRFAWYELEAVPPITWAVWPSIMSGVGPGWHGLTGFFTVDRASRESRLLTAADLEHPRIHEIASMEGREVLMLNPVPDAPLLPVRRGLTVSWFLFADRPLSNRPGVAEKYFSHVEKPSVRGCGDAGEIARELEAYLAFLEDQVGRGYELVWVTLRYPDHYFHKCMRAVDSDPGLASPIFRVVDRILRLLDSESESLMVVSDHGFARFRVQVSVNDILARHGLAVPGRSAARAEAQLLEEKALDEASVSRVYVPPWLYRAVKAARLDGLARAALRLAGRLAGRRIAIRTGFEVDLARSRAALLRALDYGVYVFEGDPAEVAGVLSRYEGLRVYLARDALPGPYSGRAPDVLVLPDFSRGYLISSRFIKGVIYAPTSLASHSDLGVMGVRGPLAGLAEELAGPPGGRVGQTLPGALALCALGLPLPAQSPHAGRCGRSKDYTARWRAAKRVWLAVSGRRGRGG